MNYSKVKKALENLYNWEQSNKNPYELEAELLKTIETLEIGEKLTVTLIGVKSVIFKEIEDGEVRVKYFSQIITNCHWSVDDERFEELEKILSREDDFIKSKDDLLIKYVEVMVQNGYCIREVLIERKKPTIDEMVRFINLFSDGYNYIFSPRYQST